MKVIAQKIWNEPAAAIGLLATVVLLVINLLGDKDWGAQNVIAILAPFATSLGIRGLVMPMSKLEEATKPEQVTVGTTYQKRPSE
jgi:hypothetical protein